MRKSTLYVGISLLFLLTGCKQEIHQYEQSWEHRAHQLQRQLDNDQPLTRTTFIGTHNSYNSQSYTTPQSYLDPNQTHSITDQLRMDVRALELDVHSFFAYDQDTGKLEEALLLCHGMDNHLGCSPWDREFSQGLKEIADWLSDPSNQQELLLIYIEDHIKDGHYPYATQLITDTLGEHIYLPENNACTYINRQLTEQDILAQGKNLVLISDGCQNGIFNQYVHGGFSDGPGGYPTASTSSLATAPSCIDATYTRDQIGDLFVRMQEDRTVLSNLVGAAGPKVTPDVVTNMLACEINLIGMDKLRPFDGRLAAAIWSWDSGQPEESDEAQCALHNGENRMESKDCGEAYHFACRDNVSGGWYITAQTGTWDQGFDICSAANMTFTTPFSAYDNNLLGEWKDTLVIGQVWIGYANHQGTWLAY